MVLLLDSPQTAKAGKPSSSPLEESTGIIGKLNKEILSAEQNQAKARTFSGLTSII